MFSVILCLISVSQTVFPPPVEPSLPDAGPGPVLLLLCDSRSFYVPEQVFEHTVQCLSCLQQPASRWVQECDHKDRASGKEIEKNRSKPWSFVQHGTVHIKPFNEL